MVTDAQFETDGDSQIHGRWGYLSANTSYDHHVLEPVDKPSWVLDLDMSTTSPQTFETEKLTETASVFSQSIYWMFRKMVTDEFLEFYGGKL